MLKVRTLIGLMVFGLAFSIGFVALAKTPDGQTPAEETVCDGLNGAAFGLCNAYCEAMDCDSPEGYAQHPNACDKVLGNFQKKTDGGFPPCITTDCENPFVCDGENNSDDFLCNTGLCELPPPPGFDHGPICFTNPLGNGTCSFDFTCADLEPCDENSECAEGFVCLIDTCCGDSICAPEQVLCPPPGQENGLQQFNQLLPLDGPTAGGN